MKARIVKFKSAPETTPTPFRARLASLAKDTPKNRAKALALLNERHFTVHVGSRFVVCDTRTAKHAALPQRPRDFELRYLPWKYHEDGRQRDLGKLWLNWAGRRSYEGEMVFRPTGALVDVSDEDFNTWRGFALEPKRGDWNKFRDHLRTIVCRGNDAYFNYLLDYFAHMVQFPGRLPGVAIVIHGPQGTGKTIVYKMLELLFHRFNRALFEKSTRITGNFNSHLAEKILVCADEAFFARDKQIVGVLKSTITAEQMYFEAKGLDAVPMDNYIRLLITSNDEHVVHAAEDERRYFVLEPADTYAQQRGETLEAAAQRRRPYFDPISRQMLTEGGAAAMLYELQQREGIDAFDPRVFPDTPYLVRQKELSREPQEQWLADALDLGMWFERPHVKKTDVKESYDQWMRAHNQRYVKSWSEIGRYLCAVFGLGIAKKISEKTVGGRRRQVPVYVFPPLAEAREKFNHGPQKPAGKLRVSLKKTRS